MIAPISESRSSPNPALIARRRRTTLGVGILMILAGRFCIFGGRLRRRVADLPLMMEPSGDGRGCDTWRPYLNPTSKPLPAIFGDAPRRRVPTSSYRGGWWKSILALIAIVCIMSPRALAAASQPLAQQSADALPAHALKSSPSLYLREAEQSAIRWQRWGPETFALARALNRPMLIDIGAVWCHWCHVMDQTTYADPEVVAELNRNFVPVKVDTDERPDIDAYYQNAAAHLTGAGGWPLTCFTTSDGALFFAAGYLPPRPGAGPNGSGRETSSVGPLLKRIA